MCVGGRDSKKLITSQQLDVALSPRLRRDVSCFKGVELLVAIRLMFETERMLNMMMIMAMIVTMTILCLQDGTIILVIDLNLRSVQCIVLNNPLCNFL